MPRVETLVIWKFIHVAFTMNDYGEINDVATGLSRGAAVDACLNKHSGRMSKP